MMADSQFKHGGDKHLVIKRVCQAIDRDNLDEARAILRADYPFVAGLSGYTKLTKPIKAVVLPNKNQKPRTALPEHEVCMRDAFTDRYTGHKLVYKWVLQLITYLLPDDFPVTGSWIMAKTHIAYYDLWPSIDHIKPFSRGGSNDIDNLVTASWANNLIKSNYTLEEIGGRLLPPGDIAEWDGLFGWYENYASNNPDIIAKVGWAKEG